MRKSSRISFSFSLSFSSGSPNTVIDAGAGHTSSLLTFCGGTRLDDSKEMNKLMLDRGTRLDDSKEMN
jgi:hypothetical protein